MSNASYRFREKYGPIRADLKTRPGNLNGVTQMSISSCYLREKEKVGWSTNPCLFRSTRLGATARTYVHVQMPRRMTRRRAWKLNRADYGRGLRKS